MRTLLLVHVCFLMIRLPPSSTPPDPLFPCTPLSRSLLGRPLGQEFAVREAVDVLGHVHDDSHIVLDDKKRDAEFLVRPPQAIDERSEEHTSELQSLMRSSYAVFCLNKTKSARQTTNDSTLTRKRQYQISR